MKKLLAILISVVLLVGVLPLGAMTASAETSGYYTYTVSNGKAAITDCNESISGAVTIPSTLGGYPVTSIGSYAFYKCKSLTSINIPDSVTSIASSAFYYCTGLTSINVSSDNNYYSSQNGVLFSKNKKELICYPAGKTTTSYKIPNSVTSISYYAFYACDSLTSITIPDSVTRIGDYAFYACDSLTSITIPTGVKSIGDYAFYNCTSLKNVFIPKSVVLIKTMAFFGCSGIKNIYFEGSTEEWNKITIFSGNDYLKNATVYFKVYKNGDLNGDKTTNVLDFIVLNKAIADNDASADVNSDGTVNASDLVYLKKILLGVI